MKTYSKLKLRNIQCKLIEWGNCNFVQFPWRITENQFHGLIAEILLQRTRAEQVVPVFQTFSLLFPTIESASREGGQIIKILKPLGLEWRAKKLVELINVLNSSYKEVPESKNELLDLPGVGDYVASAFITFHTKYRALIIDSNAVRLWSRVFDLPAEGETRRKKWFIDIVDKATPLENHRAFNYAVLDFTRGLCKRKPLCMKCPIKELCKYYVKFQH